MTSVHRKLENLLLDHGERGEPIAFAGREHIIRAIAQKVERIAVRPLEGETFVISGAPGAGKTSLVRELARRLNVPCICLREVPDDSEVQHLWNELATKLTGLATEEIRAIQHRTHYGEGGISALVKAGGGFSEGVTLNPPSVNSCTQIRALTDQPFETPVVVCVDEIQNIEKDSPANALVRHLHTQEVAPVLLVCAGLANALERLREIGISRFSDRNIFALGALTAEETMNAAKQSLQVIETIGVGTPSRKQSLAALAEKIVVAADNWPRHLTCYLHGVCEELLEQVQPSFDQLDQEKVIERGNRLRQAYYEDRLVASRLPACVLARLYDRVRNAPISRDACADILEVEIREYDQEGAAALKRRFASGDAAVEQVLRSGILTLGKEHNCEVPIPSMASFISQKSERERAEVLRSVEARQSEVQ